MGNNRENKRMHINLNINVRGIPQSATLRINELSEKLKSEGRQIIKFGLEQSPFPVPEPVVVELKMSEWVLVKVAVEEA